MNTFLEDLATTTIGHFSIIHALLNICIGFGMGLVIAAVYRLCFSGFSYSRSFLFALVFLTTISTLVIIAIGESVARAFALAGALSIIRFRTPIKDSKDLTFIFFALIVGLAMGTGKILIAVSATLLISLFMLIYHRMVFSVKRPQRFLLHILAEDMGKAKNMIESNIAPACREIQLASASYRADTNLADLAYVIHLKAGQDTKKLASALELETSIKSIDLNPLSDTVDY
jgi:uncharacterized membrane protein YhiD involved in acid resistance